MEKKVMLEIPIGMDEEDGVFIAYNIEETNKIIGDKIGIVVQEETEEKAKEQFLVMLADHISYLGERSGQLDLWKPFQKGHWKIVGGRWFTIFGIHVFFRYGKGMLGGRYIPLTKLNVSITNHWRKRK